MSGPRALNATPSLLNHNACSAVLYALLLSVEDEEHREPRLLTVTSEALSNLIAHQDNLGYIKYIRLDRALFADLLARFAPLHEQRLIRSSTSAAPPKPRLSRRALTSAETLFALLRFLAASSNLADLSVIAGVSFSTMSRTLRRGLVTLLVVLRHWNAAAVRVPSNEEAVQLSARVSRRIPYLHNFIGFADGVPSW